MAPELFLAHHRVLPARGPLALAGALLALLLATPARADIYVCTTREGQTISREFPPPECKDRDVRQLNSDGSLRRIMPAPLTKEQRRQRALEEQERIRQEETEQAQARRDRSLLETYGSVPEIEAARKRALSGRQALVDRADQRIVQYQRERKRLDEEAEFYVKREMPAPLKDRFEANKVLVQQQEKTRADALNEMTQINLRFDADVKRYQELEEMATKAAEAREREANQMSQ